MFEMFTFFTHTFQSINILLFARKNNTHNENETLIINLKQNKKFSRMETAI